MGLDYSIGSVLEEYLPGDRDAREELFIGAVVSNLKEWYLI